jgi:uncharacterized protein YigE (DUF2233 family)
MKILIAMGLIPLFLGLAPNPKNSVVYYKVDSQKERISLVWKNKENKLLKSISNVLKNDSSYTMIMNAGMYKTSLSPLGLYVENGVIHQDLNTKKSAYGNFYMQPNGVFYSQNDSLKITQTSDFKLDSSIAFATQSGPMLLINGEFHPKFMKGSKNLHIRNGVGILPDGNPIFAISTVPINLYDFADFFKVHGCRNALYLDGAVSRAYIPSKGLFDKGGKFGAMVTVKPL